MTVVTSVLAVMSPQVHSEHVPDNWDDMELHKWYDLVPGDTHVSYVFCDPEIENRLYGLKDEYIPAYSNDFGETWTLMPTGLEEFDCNYGEFVLHIDELGTRNYYLVLSDGACLESSNLSTLLKKTNLHSPWQIVHTFEEGDLATEAFMVTRAGTCFIVTAGSNGAKLRRSTDGGETWETLKSDPNIRKFKYISESPHVAGCLYAAGHVPGEFLVVSHDNGDSWQSLPFPENQAGSEGLWRVIFHPHIKETLYVIINEDLYSVDHSVWVSHDSGQTWAPFTPLDETAAFVNDIHFNRHNPDIITMVTWQDSILRSTDGGLTFDYLLSKGTKSPYSNRRNIVEIPWRESQLFTSSKSSIFFSHDDGNSWRRYFITDPQKIHVDLEQPKRMILTTGDGLFYSLNGGQNWHSSIVMDVVYRNFGINSEIVTDHLDPDTVYLVNQAHIYPEVWRTRNFGIDWEKIFLHQGVNTSLYVSASSHTPGKLWTIERNNVNNSSLIVQSLDYGETWNELIIDSDFIFSEIVDNPSDGQRVYAIGHRPSDEVGFFFRSQDGGQTWSRFGPESGFLSDRLSRYITDNWIAIDFQNPIEIRVGYTSQSKNENSISFDDGQSWKSFKHPGSSSSKGSFFRHAYDRSIITSNSYISKDEGVTWSRLPDAYSCRLRIPNSQLSIIIDRENLRILRMNSEPPVIQAAGFICDRSTVIFSAAVSDPSVNDRIDHLEMCIEGEPVGYTIDAPGEASTEIIYHDFGRISGAYGQYPVQFRPIDKFGNLGQPWPNIVIK